MSIAWTHLHNTFQDGFQLQRQHGKPYDGVRNTAKVSLGGVGDVPRFVGLGRIDDLSSCFWNGVRARNVSIAVEVAVERQAYPDEITYPPLFRL